MADNSFAKQRLVEASRSKDLALRLSLLFTTCAAVVSALLVIALTDYWIVLPVSVRTGGVLLLTLIFAAGALRLRAAIRRPTELKEVALDAETRKGDAGCELSTAAEYLSGKRKPVQDYEAELADALEAKAANHLESMQVAYWSRPIPAALFLGVFALAGVLFAVVVSGGYTAFVRAAAPWSNTPYTTVEVQPGSVEIPIGKDLDVKSVFAGRVPKTAQFSWLDEGSSKWQFASLKRNEQGEYVYPLKNVRSTLNYRVSGSDAISPEFKVEPYLPPEVKDWNIALDLPAYTKKSGASQTTPDISVLRGSTAHLQIAPNVKLSKALLRIENAEAVQLKPSANGFWNGDLPVSKDAKFWIELVDEKGHASTNETPYSIAALPDEAPKVELLEPGQDMRAEATNTLPVKISVTDDYGLDEIKLVYHKLGGPEQYITARRSGETNSEFAAEIPLASLNLAEFELVAYHAEATDNNTLDGPGVGRSEVFFVEISNQEGGKCKSQGKSQRVNLLVIQKQIVADSTALAKNATPQQFEELAKRQKDAVDFGNLYAQALQMKGPPAVFAEMQAAVAEMQKAQGALEKQLRAEALPPSESALAHLYQVVNLMPELKDLPTQLKQPPGKTNRPPVLNVVLDAMKKNKAQDPEAEELASALEEAQRLQDEQASLTIGVQSTGTGAKGGAPGEMQLVRATNDSKGGEGKPQAKAKSNKAKGKSGKGTKAAAKNGQGKNGQGGQGEQGKTGDKAANKPGDNQQNNEEQKPADANEQEQPNEPPDAQELAQKQDELSKKTSELAQKLARLAGKGSRLGHGAGAKLNQAAGQMKAASQAASAGNLQSAGTKGAESSASLNQAVAMIEAALHNRPERVDVAQEEAPKEYETLIAEYLKKLSYEQ